jgi:hypothetical protein
MQTYASIALVLAGFRRIVRERGYIEAKNAAVDYCYAKGENALRAAISTIVGRQKAASIVATGNVAAVAAHRRLA